MDRLEIELDQHFTVIRLNVGSDIGTYVRQKYRAGLVPTFIVFDRSGTEIFRQTGSVPELEKLLSLNL